MWTAIFFSIPGVLGLLAAYLQLSAFWRSKPPIGCGALIWGIASLIFGLACLGLAGYFWYSFLTGL